MRRMSRDWFPASEVASVLGEERAFPAQSTLFQNPRLHQFLEINRSRLARGESRRFAGAAKQQGGISPRRPQGAALDPHQSTMAHLLPMDCGGSCRSGNHRLSLNIKKYSIPLGPALNTPGEILRDEFLVPMELSLWELARRMGCGPMRVPEIVRGKRSITAETSILLGHALGVSPAFWFGIQMDHDLALAALSLEKKAA